jgi:glucokinase
MYIAGGIAPKILDKLRDGTMLRAFLDKGRFENLMEEIPLHVVTNEAVGLLGAAALAAEPAGGSNE